MTRTYEAMRRVDDTLEELVALVETARALPLSASCVLPRERVLELLDELRAALPRAIDDARDVVATREELLGQARDRRDRAVADAAARAAAILSAARAEHERLVSATDVRRAAEAEARGVLQAARDRAERLRTEAEEYVDGRLATLEDTLSRALRTVEGGRTVLRERGAAPAPRDPDRSDTARIDSTSPVR